MIKSKERILISMKLILVAGTDHTEKNKLIGMAISTLNNGNGYKDFLHINFNGLNSVKNGFASLKGIKENYLNIYDELEKVLTSSKRNAFNIVLDASFTTETPYGYAPILTERFFNIFSPDAIVLLENRLEDFRDNPRELQRVKDHQEINRAYCFRFASKLSIPVKVIKVDKGEKKSSVMDIQNYLTSVQRASF